MITKWKYVILFLLIILTIYLRLHSQHEPLERDLTLYAYIAHQMTEGKELYGFLVENKPPAVFISYMLAELLLGYEQISITWLGIFFTVLSLIFIFLFLQKIAGSGAAIIGSIFWTLASNSIMLQANQPNTEVFINAFTIMGLWAFAMYCGGKKNYLLVAGIFLAMATWFKLIVAFLVFLLCGYLLFIIPRTNVKNFIKNSIKPITVFILPTIILWVGTFIYFALQERFTPFWNVVFVFNRYYAGNVYRNIWVFFTSPNKLFSIFLSEIWILVLLSYAYFCARSEKCRYFKKIFFFFLLLVLYFEVASPGKPYPHYLQLLLPALCILPALFFHNTYEIIRAKETKFKKTGLAALLAFSVVFLGYYQFKYLKMSPFQISHKKYGNEFIDSYLLADTVKKMTDPDEKVYEWGCESGINYYSKRNSPSGILFLYHVLGNRKNQIERRKRLFEEVTTSRPKLFIYNEKYGKLEENIFYEFLMKNYDLVKTFPNKRGYYFIFKIRKTL